MAELGELSLWAALPLAVLATVASFGGGWTGRADLARVGWRSADAAAVLQLIALAGLVYALVTVQLRFVYVAAVTGFNDSPLSRLAATWSAPQGGALVLSLVITVIAAVSGRLGRTRQAAARTGAVAALAVIGLLMVLARAQPFAQREAPALVGGALPFALKSYAWQIELWAVYLAVAFGGLALADVVGGQLVDTRGSDRVGRGAMRLATTTLSVAILASAWRLYAGSGRLFDVAGYATLAVYLPAWLLALSYLHAPGGPVSPVWAARWKRILGVAFFPAVVAAAASVVGAGGAVPSAILPAGGLAIGVLAGAMAGLAGAAGSSSRALKALPGFGLGAFAGGLLPLGSAGIVVTWSLFKGPGWSSVAGSVALVGVAGAVSWSIARPAVGRRWAWLALAMAVGAAAAAVAYLLSGRNDPAFLMACAVAGAALVGAGMEWVRLHAVRRARRGDALTDVGDALRVRAGRRRASVVGHLGFALVLVGLSADGLRVEDSRPLSPGQGFELRGRFGELTRVTYLGLSRYQVGQLDKRVASLRLYRGGASQLAAPALISDFAVGRVSREPTVARGALGDVIVDIAGRVGDEAILCRVAYRPLANCVWLGWLLIAGSFLVGGGLREKR